MPKVLVVANRTVAGRKLLDRVRELHEKGDHQFHLVVPIARPQHGNVIYDEAARDAAQLRIDLARAYLGRMGIDLTGEIGDEDPHTATPMRSRASPRTRSSSRPFPRRAPAGCGATSSSGSPTPPACRSSTSSPT
jgi:hypothetical protein